MPKAYPLYVVDDDPSVHDWAQIVCEEMGYRCRMFRSGEEFLNALDDLEPGCVLLDMRMPRRTGLQVQAEIARSGRNMPVVAMTGFGDVGVAVQSMKLGAIDFLEKPFDKESLTDALTQGFKRLGEASETASDADGR